MMQQFDPGFFQAFIADGFQQLIVIVQGLLQRIFLTLESYFIGIRPEPVPDLPDLSLDEGLAFVDQLDMIT